MVCIEEKHESEVKSYYGYASSWRYWSHVHQALSRCRGKNGGSQRKIPVSAEIKKSMDWMRPGRHSQCFGFARGCSMLRTSDWFTLFTLYLSVYDLVLCLPVNKVLLHSALRTPGDLFTFEIFWTNWGKWSRSMTQEGSCFFKNRNKRIWVSWMLLIIHGLNHNIYHQLYHLSNPNPEPPWMKWSRD